MAQMRELLPGLKVWGESMANFDFWETVGESYDPYGDYRGKSAGLLIPVEHLPRFAVILASAMKAEGQALNALGECRLAVASPARAATVLFGNRGGVTTVQRTRWSAALCSVVPVTAARTAERERKKLLAQFANAFRAASVVEAVVGASAIATPMITGRGHSATGALVNGGGSWRSRDRRG